LVTNKKILITAGPTWVALDRVRVISNLATGETGCLLADKFKKLGAKVTLLLGPGNFCDCQPGIRVIRFNYFSQLARLLDQELKSKKFAAVIHAAAVADYQPQEFFPGKISSVRKNWSLNLVPTPKLINQLKAYQADLLTVGFKFEPEANYNQLLKRAGKLLKTADLDLVVANSNKSGYRAYILDGCNKYGPFLTKVKMAVCLAGLIGRRLC